MQYRMIKSETDLPRLVGAREVFADFETASWDDSLKSVNPWFHCSPLGLAITVDDLDTVFYVPVGHRQPTRNLDLATVARWFWDILDNCYQWTNHNIKYDAHVAENYLFSVIGKSMRWRMSPLLNCTLTSAKIIDSDRLTKGGYGLDVLARDWLGRDISPYEQAMSPYLDGTQDYSRVPSFILSEYACCDVHTNRDLARYIEKEMPEQCRGVADTEVEVTRVLFEAEQSGIRVDPQQLLIAEYENIRKRSIIDERLEKLIGRPIRAHVPGDCLEVLCGQFGLPVLKWNVNDEGVETSASFDKEALALYQSHPDAQFGKVKDVLDNIVGYRKLNQQYNLFITSLRDYNIDGIVHATTNQTVRTGRMSQSEPNLQQQDKSSKKLIHPLDGMCFWSKDYSQIEFRAIVDYVGNQRAIDIYNSDPFADFHVSTGRFCHIKRSPAKTMNFAVSFGMGKKKTLARLASDPDIVAEIKEALGEDFTQDLFHMMASERANNVYSTWHATYPEVKPTSKQAERACKARGYVFNRYGRRRHLPYEVAHIAFNTVIQSFAADLMKERLAAYWREYARPNRICIGAIVHDEILSQVPIEMAHDQNEIRKVLDILEAPSVDMKVPIVSQIGISEKSWFDADDDADFFARKFPDFERAA